MSVLIRRVVLNTSHTMDSMHAGSSIYQSSYANKLYTV